MQRRQVFLWILALSFVAVGARNFELGLSSDGPIYSTIARNLLQSGDWFYLNSSVPDYTPYFADHPHLGIWLVALSFKLFGIGDYAARIPGHIFYFGFLSLLFFYIRKQIDEKTALLTIFALWIWGRFSNSFSAVYLDPGVHFFGFSAMILFESALEKPRWKVFLSSGLCLALVALMKGLTLLGYFPAIGVLFIIGAARSEKKNEILKGCLVLMLGFLIPCALYYLAVKYSSTADFFEAYWARQVTNRFAKVASIENFFSLHFWKPLLEDTNYYSLFALLALPKASRLRPLRLLSLIALGFICLYAPNRCSGAHYFIPIIPALALGLAVLIAPYFTFEPSKIAKGLTGICLLAIFIIQYVPVRTHGMRPTEGEELILALHKSKKIETLWIDGTPVYTDFINSSRYTWWGHVSVKYVKNGEEVPLASLGHAYLLFWKDAYGLRKDALTAKNWCLFRRFSQRSVWLPCPVDPTEHLETVYEK